MQAPTGQSLIALTFAVRTVYLKSGLFNRGQGILWRFRDGAELFQQKGTMCVVSGGFFSAATHCM